MNAQNEDFLFAQEAQNLGYVTEAQVEEGFLLQKRMADDLQIDERLAVILVKRGWLADEQARRVYGIIEPEGARSQIEGYRLVEKVGRGAMGTVYKAMHKGLNRVVAIKILRRDLAADKTQIERLKREAKLLAELEHPNVVRAFDAGESNGFPYLVMEFVEGETLRDKIAREGPLSEEFALRVTRGIADALEKARRMGVVHRDVKPGNILIKTDGTPKLMDLGLAKGPIDAGLTQHGATVGTPQFMSPEQAESPDKADTRSDIYSLGATLYAMVTGRPPFEGSTLAEIITKVMSQQPVPPGMANKDVSSEVSHLIERMMLKDASLRYATPALVIEDIDRIRGGQSIIPRGFQGNWEAYLLRKRFLAWRKRIVLGVATAAVLVVGVLMYLDNVQKTVAEEDIASKVAKLLEVGAPVATDTQETLARRLVTLREGEAAIHRISDSSSVPYPEEERRAITQRIQAIDRAHRLLVECEDLREDVTKKSNQGKWKEALGAVRDQRGKMAESEPSAACWRSLVDELRDGSRRALEAEEARVAAMPVADINGFLRKYAARDALYTRGWIEEGDFGRLRTAAETSFKNAKRVGQHLGAFHIAFAAAAIEARVTTLQFYDLRRELAAAADELTRDVRAEVTAWPDLPQGERALVEQQLLGPDGLIPVATEAAEAEVDAQVRGAWQNLKRRVPTVAVNDALDALRAFANEAERGEYYRDLADEARAEEGLLRTAENQRRDAERRAFEQLRRRVLVDLRRGEPDAILEAITATLAQAQLLPSRRRDAEALAEAAHALVALQTGALEGLAVMRTGDRAVDLENVRYRLADDSWSRARRWVLRDLDVDGGVLVVRTRGDRKNTTFRIQQVHVDNLRAWMRRGNAVLSPLHDAILKTAVLPLPEDARGRDLRPLLGSYRALRERFGDDGSGPVWRRLIGELALRLDGWQQSREDEATRAIQFVSKRFYDSDWKELIAIVDDLLDPAGRLRYTRAVENVIGELSEKRRLAREALDKDELRRMFRGDVQPKEFEGGQTELVFDFDDAKQLGNFLHGLGRWRSAGPVVTGRERSGGELHLLPEVKGFLRDRPLVLESPFDPARPMALELRANFLRGSAMLAFDLDGVQIAICSFDPNYWKRRFRVGAPRLGDEEVLPEFDFYGMGRGIAFHYGQHFGRSFPYGRWDWAVDGQGRNFVKLKERAEIEEAGGRLFAFEPGTKTVVIRIERDRNFMRLLVDGTLVYQGENHRWAQVGATSEIDGNVRNGSGKLQILTWTPMVIDDLVLRGTIRKAWKDARRKELAAEASNNGAGKGADAGEKGGNR